MEYIRIGSLAEVPEGEMRAFELPAGRVLVAHVANRLFAAGDECPHAGCALSEGVLAEAEPIVTCACHESAFDLESGEPVDGPARDPVLVFAARQDDEGWIEVASEPEAG